MRISEVSASSESSPSELNLALFVAALVGAALCLLGWKARPLIERAFPRTATADRPRSSDRIRARAGVLLVLSLAWSVVTLGLLAITLWPVWVWSWVIGFVLLVALAVLCWLAAGPISRVEHAEDNRIRSELVQTPRRYRWKPATVCVLTAVSMVFLWGAVVTAVETITFLSRPHDQVLAIVVFVVTSVVFVPFGIWFTTRMYSRQKRRVEAEERRVREADRRAAEGPSGGDSGFVEGPEVIGR